MIAAFVWGCIAAVAGLFGLLVTSAAPILNGAIVWGLALVLLIGSAGSFVQAGVEIGRALWG